MPPSFMKGGDTMTVFESLSLMIGFGMLIIAILAFGNDKK